jgi:serine/threonine-protein kinase
VARDLETGTDVILHLVREPFAHEQPFLEALTTQVRPLQQLSEHTSLPVRSLVRNVVTQPFLVTPFVRATLLSERIRRLAPFSVPVSVSTAISICEGLDQLHALKVVHGDLSSNNVYVLPDGQVRLALPGIWQAYAASESAGQMVHPLMAPYLSPEISRGQMPSVQSDIYAVGVLLHELLTGRLPFNSDSASGMAASHSVDPIPSLRTYNPSVPMVLDEIVKKTLSKEPAGRYASAQDLLEDLRALQDALRFGRSLTWPIKVREPVASPRVTPRMSAIRKEETEEVRESKRRGGDVPAWLIGTFVLAVLVFVGVVGVWAAYNLNRPKLVVVPNIKGSSLAEARKTLQLMNLGIRVSGRSASERYPVDTVLETNPIAGDKVRERSDVGVKLSSGSRFVDVPDLKGMTLDSARSALSQIKLNLVEPPNRVDGRNAEPGTILSQDPPAAKKVERYSAIRVNVAGISGQSAAKGKKTLYTLTVTLEGLSKPVNVRVTATDDVETKTLTDELRQPDEELTLETEGVGEEVVFRIYYNGEMVKQVTKKASEGETVN